MTTFNEQFGAMLIKAVRKINRRANINKLRFGNCRYTAMKWTNVGIFSLNERKISTISALT